MGNRDIKVSVIVLAYNHEKYIRQAIDSILAQKVDFAYEILIGDDASCDGTSAIVSEYAAKLPKTVFPFIRERNLGASANAYDLLTRAKGEYLAFCEADDFWVDSEKLQRQVDFLDKHSEYIGCAHRCVIVDGDNIPKRHQRIKWVRERKCFTLKDFRGIYLPGQTATIVKRNLFQAETVERKLEFLYTTNRNISDRTATMFYLTRGPFHCMRAVMSAYRITNTQSNLTAKLYEKNPQKIADELHYTEELELLLSKMSHEKRVFLPYYRQLYAVALLQYIVTPCLETKTQLSLFEKHFGHGLIHPFEFVAGILEKLAFRYGLPIV